jgi:hypothetical protein
MAAHIAAEQSDKRKYCPYCTHNHQYDTYCINVKSVLHRIGCDCEFENGSDRKATMLATSPLAMIPPFDWIVGTFYPLR